MGCVPRPTSRTDLHAALPRPKKLIQFRPGHGGVARVGHERARRRKISDPAAPCRAGNWMKKFDAGSAMRVVGLVRWADGGQFAGLVQLAAAGPGTPSRAHLETRGVAASHPAHFS